MSVGSSTRYWTIVVDGLNASSESDALTKAQHAAADVLFLIPDSIEDWLKKQFAIAI